MSRDGLLRFADTMGRETTPAPAPVAGGELHLITFALDREEYGIKVGSGARGHPGDRDHPGAAVARRTCGA